MARRFARPNTEARNLAKPLEVAQHDRFVEPVVGPQFLDLIVGQGAAGASVEAARRNRAVAARHRCLVQHALDRPTRHQPGERKDQDRDTDEGWHDQDEAAYEVAGHDECSPVPRATV